jgi:hypothetical protein
VPDFRFNERAGRFRGPNGRFLSSDRVRRIIDATLLKHTNSVSELTELLRQHGIPVGEWERRMRQEIKAIHTYSAMAAKGGRAQLDNRDFGRIGAAVKRQYKYLRGFADDISSGKQRLDGGTVSRARLYAQAGRGSFEKTRQTEMRARGFAEERNILAPAEHCEGAGSCVEQTERGWVPVGELIPIGGRLCVVNCKCRIEYRNADGEIAA